MKEIFLGYPEIIGTVHGVGVPVSWFWETGYSGQWETAESVVSSIKQARTFEKDSDELGKFAYKSVFGYLDPFDKFIPSLGYKVYVDNYKNLIKKKVNFLVPIPSSEFSVGKWGASKPCLEQTLPGKLQEVQFPEDLSECFRSGVAKLVFYGLWEITQIDPEDLRKFCCNKDIPEKAILVCSPNTELKAEYKNFFGKEGPGVVNYNSFADLPWVGTEVGFREMQRDRYYAELKDSVRPGKILCLNRRWSPERLFTVGYLEQKHKGEVITSLGGNYNIDNSAAKAISEIKNTFTRDTAARKATIGYYRTFTPDCIVCHSPDMKDPTNIENSVNYVKELQDSAYVNLVTETSFAYNKGIFFTEKIYKPVWALQPFILVAAPHSLDRFRKLGFKTFDKWWDESYDEIEDFQSRLEAILKTVDYVCSKTLEELHVMCQEMEDVLVHNFNHYIYSYKNSYPRVLEEIYTFQQQSVCSLVSQSQESRVAHIKII